MQKLAWKKHKMINNFFAKIKDKEFVALYSPIPHQIVKLCQVALIFQFLTYLLLAISIFSMENYTYYFGEIVLDQLGVFQMYALGKIEKTIMWSAVVPTSMWLSIFMLQLYEQHRMVKDIERLDVQKIMTQTPGFTAEVDLIKIKEDEKIR